MKALVRHCVRLSTIAASLCAGAAHAADDPAYDRFFLTPNVSTLGAGIEAGYRANESWRLRAGVNGGSVSYVWHDRNSDLPSTLTLLSAGFTADYFPFAAEPEWDSFYLSGGLRFSANRIEGKVRNMKARMGATQVFVEDALTDFTVRQNVVQPYLGFGYSAPINQRVSLNFDLGALYAGSPSLSYKSRATELGFTRDEIRREVERARDRIEPYRFLPVVQVGLKIHF